jgi:dTDP-4-amino-4,6-dideoxygalactose transaminase
LPHLPAWTARRRALAARYRRALAGGPVRVPPECDPGHVYHLFPVRSDQRDALGAHLERGGIGSLVHYPVPVPRQPALAGFNPAACPIADQVAAEVCSLPLHPRLSDEAADLVAEAVLGFAGGREPRAGG